jgi:hypothetical protein
MPTITEFVTSTQDQVIATLKQGEEAIVEGLRSVSETVEGYAPFTAELPKPADAVESAFAFANSVLTSQRDFVESVLNAVLPAAPKATAPKAPSTAAKKA